MGRRHCLLIALALLYTTVPQRADAAFRLMSISELGVDFLDEPFAQFVELRLDAKDQTDLTNTRLTAFDKDGIPTVLLLTDHGISNGISGANILYATETFAALTGVTPDFIIPSGILSPSGMTLGKRG